MPSRELQNKVDDIANEMVIKALYISEKRFINLPRKENANGECGKDDRKNMQNVTVLHANETKRFPLASEKFPNALPCRTCAWDQ